MTISSSLQNAKKPVDVIYSDYAKTCWYWQ